MLMICRFWMEVGPEGSRLDQSQFLQTCCVPINNSGPYQLCLQIAYILRRCEQNIIKESRKPSVQTLGSKGIGLGVLEGWVGESTPTCAAAELAFLVRTVGSSVANIIDLYQLYQKFILLFCSSELFFEAGELVKFSVNIVILWWYGEGVENPGLRGGVAKLFPAIEAFLNGVYGFGALLIAFFNVLQHGLEFAFGFIIFYWGLLNFIGERRLCEESGCFDGGYFRNFCRVDSGAFKFVDNVLQDAYFGAGRLLDCVGASAFGGLTGAGGAAAL